MQEAAVKSFSNSNFQCLTLHNLHILRTGYHKTTSPRLDPVTIGKIFLVGELAVSQAN